MKPAGCIVKLAALSALTLVLGCYQRSYRTRDDFSKKIECERLAKEYEREQRTLLRSDPNHMDRGWFSVEKVRYSVSRNSCICVGRYSIPHTGSIDVDLTVRDTLSHEDLWNAAYNTSTPEKKQPNVDKVLESYK